MKKFTYHQETNKNSVLLIDIINEKEFVKSNTCFKKKMNKCGHICSVLQDISA